jgi:hypothetical protein
LLIIDLTRLVLELSRAVSDFSRNQRPGLGLRFGAAE